MKLRQLVDDIAASLKEIDALGEPFKTFQPGVGPYGEPQLVRLVSQKLNQKSAYQGHVATKRSPDLLIRGKWAIECKIARPYGDNGNEAENWSVNLLHPYPGNVSVIGDCMKLWRLGCSERKAVTVIGYEHSPPKIHLEPLFSAFEVVAHQIARIKLGPRVQVFRSGLRHPVHQQLTVVAWEVLGVGPRLARPDWPRRL